MDGVLLVANDAARGALDAAVAEAKGGDPLAPVTVAVPSTYAGLALRRRRSALGSVNVRFQSLNRLAELLGAPVLAEPDRRPLTPAIRAEAVRRALAADAGPFAAVADHPSTIAALETTFAELARAPQGSVRRLARAGPRARAVARLYEDFRTRTARYYDDDDQLHAAARMVDTGALDLRDLGQVVVFLPPADLSPAAEAFVLALARAGRARVVLGLTGDADADRDTHELASRLAVGFGELHDGAGEPGAGATEPAAATAAPSVADVIVSCSDVDDEVRRVVRLVAAELEHGTPLHRIAVAYRDAERYARLLHDHLTAAGMPFSGPSARRLAETVPGRALLGLLRLPDHDFRRDEMMALLSGVPILERPGGRPVPAPRWDRLSCEAGVVAGIVQWHDRLAARRAMLEVEKPDEADTEVEHLDRLARFVDELGRACVPPARPTWSALAGWATRLLDRFVGRGHTTGDWPAEEQRALEDVRVRVESLGGLNELGPAPDPSVFVLMVARELDGRLGHVGHFGDGVFVAPVAALAGTTFDVVVVVGMTEGAFPPPPRDDPWLPEAERPEWGLRAGRRDRERRDYLAALGAAGRRVLLFPRADERARRALRPSAWVLEAASARAGIRVFADDLDATSAVVADGRRHGWLEIVESAEAAILATKVAGTVHEHDLAALVRWRHAGRSPSAHPLAVGDAGITAGFATMAARDGRSYGPWDGVIGPRPGVVPEADRPFSPTTLEAWARCPFRYFLHRALRLRELERPEDVERFRPSERGRLVHTALQRFLVEHPRDDPRRPWTVAERIRLQEIGSALCQQAEAQGLTGRPLLWALDRRRLLDELDAVLDTDESLRRERGLVPRSFELPFGFDEPGSLPALTLALDGVPPVVLRGRIDRVDEHADGGGLEVFDYKTGNPDGDDRTFDDPVLAGTRLQLAVYALALRAAHPGVAVRASYWFTRRRGPEGVVGFDLDESLPRIREVLAAILAGIATGVFPADPGAEEHFGPSNCRYCEYDRLCARDRVRRWERRVDDPVLTGYLGLRAESVHA